jgi:hypothetical protein
MATAEPWLGDRARARYDRVLSCLSMVSPARTEVADDPTIYPEGERVGEDIVQRWIAELLRPLVERWLRERGEVAFVGADQFIYYEQFNSTARVAPDIYVLPGVPPETHVRTWKVWETGIAPRFALEIVSTDGRKDYEEAPERHDAAGTEELVVFDPWPATRPRGEGIRWQIFRRGPKGLARVETSDADRVASVALGGWLRVIGDALEQRVRLSSGPTGDAIFPTAEEAERHAKEAEREAKEAEREAKEAALARIAELEAELRRRS